MFTKQLVFRAAHQAVKLLFKSCITGRLCDRLRI